MNENIRTFSLVTITICVFIIMVLQILDVIQEQKARSSAHALLHQGGVSSEQGMNPFPSAENDSALNLPLTSIQFDEMKFDFGDIRKGDIVKHSFKFRNSGSNPLIISNAHGTCGCTIPSYPKEPVPPGGEAVLEVEFNSTGKEGLQNKSISVAANTDPQYTVLSIAANVKPAE